MRFQAHDLACRRGGREVFAGLSFAVSAGGSLALRGPNGSGKSTLLRLAAGLIHPEAGSLRLDGGDAERTIAEQAHLLGHLDAVKPALTVAENLAFWRDMLDGEKAGVRDALERVGLARLAAFPAAILSAGQRRRLSLARLVAVRRPVWLLDEPTNALDADGRARLDNLIAGHLASGGIALVATHVDMAGVTATLELGAVS